jgi:cytoskeletal protein RodZ
VRAGAGGFTSGMETEPTDRAERVAAFSTWLARERELRGLSRGDVLLATRLAPAVVDALEAGESSRLPPRAYVLGYLRAYAAAVGLDADEVVLRFEEAAGGEVAGARRARRRNVPFRLWVVAFALALAAAALWLLLRG